MLTERLRSPHPPPWTAPLPLPLLLPHYCLSCRRRRPALGRRTLALSGCTVQVTKVLRSSMASMVPRTGTQPVANNRPHLELCWSNHCSDQHDVKGIIICLPDFTHQSCFLTRTRGDLCFKGGDGRGCCNGIRSEPLAALSVTHLLTLLLVPLAPAPPLSGPCLKLQLTGPREMQRVEAAHPLQTSLASTLARKHFRKAGEGQEFLSAKESHRPPLCV